MNLLDLFTVIAARESIENFNSKSHLSEMLQSFKINSYLPLDIEGSYLDNEQKINQGNILSEIDKLSIYVYDFTGHTGDWYIKEVNSINDAEKYILSPGGYLNMFSTNILVIHKGKIKDFKVYETLQNGKKQYVKDDQDCINRDSVNVDWF